MTSQLLPAEVVEVCGGVRPGRTRAVREKATYGVVGGFRLATQRAVGILAWCVLGYRYVAQVEFLSGAMLDSGVVINNYGVGFSGQSDATYAELRGEQKAER